MVIDIISLRGTEENILASIRGAVARGWCTNINQNKVMDVELAEAIAQEVIHTIEEGIACCP